MDLKGKKKEGCCKTCTERYVGCHGKCEKYIKERMEWEKWKADVKQARSTDTDYDLFKYMMVGKTKKFIANRDRK